MGLPLPGNNFIRFYEAHIHLFVLKSPTTNLISQCSINLCLVSKDVATSLSPIVKGKVMLQNVSHSDKILCLFWPGHNFIRFFDARMVLIFIDLSCRVSSKEFIFFNSPLISV